MRAKSPARLLLMAGILVVPFICAMAQEPQAPARPPLTPEKRALIAELLVVTESKKNAIAVYNSMLDQQENEMPELVWQGLANSKAMQALSEVRRAELRKEMREESAMLSKRVRELFSLRIDFPQVIEDVSYELYDKYFTESELRDVVAFYKSPTGRKSIEVLPKMFAEAMSATLERIKPQAMQIATELSNEEGERIRKKLLIETNKPPVKPGPGRRGRKRS